MSLLLTFPTISGTCSEELENKMVCVEEEYTGLLLQQGGDITVCSNIVSVPIESLSITHTQHTHTPSPIDYWWPLAECNKQLHYLTPSMAAVCQCFYYSWFKRLIWSCKKSVYSLKGESSCCSNINTHGSVYFVRVVLTSHIMYYTCTWVSVAVPSFNYSNISLTRYRHRQKIVL